MSDDYSPIKEYLGYRFWKPESGLRVLVGLDYSVVLDSENLPSNVTKSWWDTDAGQAWWNNHPRMVNLVRLKNSWDAHFDNDCDRTTARPPSFFINFALSKNFRPEWLDWAIEQGLYEPAAKVEAGTSPSGEGWEAKARAIADECFDTDTNGGCRDSLKGYSKRVMEKMQELGIKGARGIIDNPATVMRDALQGKKWWANKSK